MWLGLTEALGRRLQKPIPCCEVRLKAAILERPGQPMVIDEVALCKPRAHEVLVRTAAVGLCHSDYNYIEGTVATPLPIVLGHEVSGIVEAVGGEVSRLKPGDHVVGCLSVFCGHCDYCVTGRMVLCQDAEVKIPPAKSDRLTWRGERINQAFNLSGFAEQMLVHEHALVRIRADMPLDCAALIGCSVLTGTGAVFRTAGVEPGSTVAVIGCGGVGLAVVMGAAMAGALRVIAIDRLAPKLELAREFGATDVIDTSQTDAVAEVMSLTSGGVDYAFECIGAKHTSEQAFAMLGPDGTATVLGVMPPDLMLEIPGRNFLRQRKIQGSLMGSNRFPVDIPRLVEFYMQGRLPLDRLISKRLPLERINDGFDDLAAGNLARAVVTFPQVV